MTGPLFFRRQDVEVHLSDKGHARYLGYRIKLLAAAPLQLGNTTLAWKRGGLPYAIVSMPKLHPPVIGCSAIAKPQFRPQGS